MLGIETGLGLGMVLACTRPGLGCGPGGAGLEFRHNPEEAIILPLNGRFTCGRKDVVPHRNAYDLQTRLATTPR